MSLHRVDPRFLLPHAVARALVLGDLDEWRAGLAAAGIDVTTDVNGRPPDVVVTPPQLIAQAQSTRAQSVIVEGAGNRPLRRHAYRTRVLLRPTRQRPTLALPLDQPAPASYALERWSVVDRRWKVARMRSARALVARGLFPPWGSPIVTVATQDGGPPAFIAAAGDLGIPSNVGWFLTFGQGDALSRNAFQLFLPGSNRPTWILKFARVAGYADRFDNDERGLALAQATGGVVAARSPRLVGRFDVEGVQASVETAVAGRRLRDVLRTPGDRAAKLQLIEVIGDWILELGRLTRAPSAQTTAERDRLRREVVPRWRSVGATPHLIDALPDLPAVTQHNDLGTWNVVADGSEFVVVDWENVRERALPLWDLLYFLADAFVLLDKGGQPEQLPVQLVRLFAGDAPSSHLLFAWVRRAVIEMGIPPTAIGPLAALCWLSHSDSFGAHNADLAAFAPHEPPRLHGLEAIGRAWMTHPALGADWSAWRD